MEFTKEESQQIKGIAIIGMVMLHLFCRKVDLPYTPLIWIGSTPLIYYLGLLGDMCVPLYCFCSGYAHSLLFQKSNREYISSIGKRMIKFLLNYWVVVVLFSGVGLLLGSADLPRSFIDFLGNLLIIGMNYNGAWWFVTTYLILCVISPILCKLINETRSFLVLLTSGLLYFIFYWFRARFVIEFDYYLMQWLWNQITLLGIYQFGYVLGVLFCKNKWISTFRTYCLKNNIMVCFCVMISMLTHGFIESAFLAPFTAIPTVIVFSVTSKCKWLEKMLLFLGKHSTNIWLTHMFFYLVLFKGLVYVLKYPVLIVIFMFLLCIVSSLIIDAIKDRLWRICHD